MESAFLTEMCEVPDNEEVGLEDAIWNQSSRVCDDEGAVCQPNIKHSIFNNTNQSRSKINSLESYNNNNSSSRREQNNH